MVAVHSNSKERGEKIESVFTYTISSHIFTKTSSHHKICVSISIYCSRASVLSASLTVAHHKRGYHPCAIPLHNLIHAPCTTIQSLNADHDTRKKASPSITCPPSNHQGGPSMPKPVFMQCIRVFPPHATNPLLPRAIRGRKILSKRKVVYKVRRTRRILGKTVPLPPCAWSSVGRALARASVTVSDVVMVASTVTVWKTSSSCAGIPVVIGTASEATGVELATEV